MVELCGIEDAGRGPVIGPLVMAGVVVKEEDQPALTRMGVKDSKALNAATRELLYKRILGLAVAFSVRIITPQEIDHALSADHLNLNWLEAIKTAEIINELQSDKVIIDCPSTNCKNYTAYLKKLLKVKPELVVEHKADQNYPVVSAASIIAKVTRDREIQKIQQKIDVDFGSGYMSDEKTLIFLENHHEDYPDIFRKEWLSYKNVVFNKQQTNLETFGGPKKAAKKPAKRGRKPKPKKS